MTEPVFAVVGHPNKGKSSLVATLARDTSVEIRPEPGTTTHARRFPMRVDGELLYTLVDTPGFQRARAALDWLERHATDAASRPHAVERFVREHSGGMFRDEHELLRPIVEGACIIYVVDGAVPYSEDEYRAEMEVLRWTGQPSMAIINPIMPPGSTPGTSPGTSPRYVQQWKDALGQFFRVVRVLDVLQAPFEQQVELLRVFGELRDEWRGPLERAVEALRADRRRKRGDAARVIAELIGEAITHREVRDIARDEDASRHTGPLEEKYRGRLRQLERQARAEVEAIYGHGQIERVEADAALLDSDLLSKESWLAFGLKRRDLIAVGAVSGAVMGGFADAALLGSSFLTGTLIGAAVGGALGFFTSDKLAEVKVFHQPLGGQRLRVGPTKNANFPFVLLGRARHHHALIAGRTHAQRGRLEIRDEADTGAMNPLSDAQKRELARLFDRLRKSEPGSEKRAEALERLGDVVEELLEG